MRANSFLGAFIAASIYEGKSELTVTLFARLKAGNLIMQKQSLEADLSMISKRFFYIL